VTKTLQAALEEITASVERALQKQQASIERAVALGLRRAAARGRALLVSRSPVGATGDFRRSWVVEVLEDGSLEVDNTAPHAAIVELGSRPHMPPVEPLIEWCIRKLGMPPAQAQRVGWAIAMHIKQHGTRPHHVLLGAEAELERYAAEEIERALSEARAG
jgi:hypothetical protein